MMTIDHLEERVNDYTRSLAKVLEKKRMWRTQTRDLLVNTLNAIASRYTIGWTVQQLNWMLYSEAVNLTLNALPPQLVEDARGVADGDFIRGGSLIYSQVHNGDITVLILFPVLENMPVENSSVDLGTFSPEEVTEKMIIEKVDEFLKEMIRWEIPSPNYKIGFIS